jgi:hypothetical protein
MDDALEGHVRPIGRLPIEPHEPSVRRIDGAGGDEGRDCEFETDEGLVIYQLKSFTGRLDDKSGRRRQVIKSLNSAVAHQPKRWELVVPIDHTPGELKWFRGLRKIAGCPVEWRGLTWLNLRFAERLFIASYFLGDTRDEVINLLTEMGRREAALEKGVPDVVQQAAALVRRANEIDPHWRFEITTDGTKSSITARPAYAGAEEDRPITVKFNVVIPSTTEEGQAKLAEFERALDFGTVVDLAPEHVPEVEIDAPAGLGGTFKGPSIRFGPGQPTTTEPVDVVFGVVDPAGTSVATLSMNMVPESSGRKGTVLRGSDRSGCVTGTIAINVADMTYQVSLAFDWKTFVPSDFIQGANFLAKYQAPNLVVVQEGDRIAASEPYQCPADELIAEWVSEFVRDLAMVQTQAGMVQAVSGALTAQDAVNASGAIRLLRGFEEHKEWTEADVTFAPTAPLDQRQAFAEGVIKMERDMDEPVLLQIAGAVYPIGRRHHVTVHARVTPESRQGLLIESPTEDIKARLRPEPGTGATVRLID